MKKLIFVVVLLLIIFVLGWNLNPFSPTMFTFHDETQPARIQQFVLELKKFHIPPRIAPDFNFGLGFPVFNFYSPFSYWVTGIINLLGINIVSALKISFLLSLLVGFSSSFLLLLNFFDFYPALLGGIVYITSLYFPLDIFVRGNLAEVWFLALLPLSFHFIYKNSLKNSKKTFLLTTFILSFSLTAHNIYSLIFIPLILTFILLLKNKKNNLLAFVFALFLTSYFWLPTIMEMNLTYAKEVATLTNFRDHFLCVNQLWDSPWGFGGSTKGCINDGLSFKIGKLQIIFFCLGIFLFLYKIIFKKNQLYPSYAGLSRFNRGSKQLRGSYTRVNSFASGINKIYLFFSGFPILFLFLTLYQSQPIWEILSPVMSIIQFPWRFIGVALLGISFMSSYLFQSITFPKKSLVIMLILLLLIFVNYKYFYGQTIKQAEFEKRYLVQSYIEKKAAYSIAEYLPKSIDYNYWRSLEKKKVIPLEFVAKSTIEPFNKDGQTMIEKIGSAVSIITLFGLILFVFYYGRTQTT